MERLAFIAAIFIALGTMSVWADSPGTPGPSGYTLSDIYDYLNSGSTATISGHTLEPPSGAVPGDTRFKTLDQIYTDTKTKYDQCDATAANVTSGKKFFSTQSGSWGVQTGTKAAVPGGWSGACVWMAGDQSCPDGWPVKHTETRCASYGVAGGGVWHHSPGYYGARDKWCYSQGCMVHNDELSGMGYWECTNLAGTGTCEGQATYTYCCAQ